MAPISRELTNQIVALHSWLLRRLALENLEGGVRVRAAWPVTVNLDPRP
jgi:hypothetical protein